MKAIRVGSVLPGLAVSWVLALVLSACGLRAGEDAGSTIGAVDQLGCDGSAVEPGVAVTCSVPG